MTFVMNMDQEGRSVKGRRSGTRALRIRGAERLIRAGRVRLILFELNWAQDLSNCPAQESVRFLERYRYQFSAIGRKLGWRQPGGWMHRLSDVLARKAPKSEAGV
jgi:hypothetical protein